VLAGAPYHQKFLSHSPESYPKLGGAVNGAVSHESRAGSAEPGYRWLDRLAPHFQFAPTAPTIEQPVPASRLVTSDS
jgi:hypothetical protein